MIPLAIHCGPIGGGFGCDMGDLPSLPAEFAIILYAAAAAGLAIGGYTAVSGSGRLYWRVGRRKQIWSQTAMRLLGLSLMLSSLAIVGLGWGLVMLSNRRVPSPEWLLMLPTPALLASAAIHWWAYHIH